MAVRKNAKNIKDGDTIRLSSLSYIHFIAIKTESIKNHVVSSLLRTQVLLSCALQNFLYTHHCTLQKGKMFKQPTNGKVMIWKLRHHNTTNNKHSASEETQRNLSLQQTYDISSDTMRSQKLQQYKNRLSVSCAHNTQSASVGLITHDL